MPGFERQARLFHQLSAKQVTIQNKNKTAFHNNILSWKAVFLQVFFNFNRRHFAER
jgi:hypothetical protein